MTAPPKLSLGMPVYNGENFLAATLDSILEQSFGDFCLVIRDNASTDATQAICEDYARRDSRITYRRNDHNIGAGPNYRKVFHDCPETLYFKWAAHDDPYDPSFLARCVARLDKDDGAVLCHSRTASIDAEGQVINTWPARPDLSLDDPLARFRDVLTHRDTYCIWGVIRRAALARTPLLGDYAAHDRPLLAELSLMGRMVELDDVLFFDREHPDRSVRAYDASKPHLAAVWYDPRNRGKLIFPEWRLLLEYVRAVNRVGLPARIRARCYAALAGWAYAHRGGLADDLLHAGARVPLLGRGISATQQRIKARRWTVRTQAAARQIDGLAGPDDKVLLVDGGSVDTEPFRHVETLPFADADGRFYGLPATDADAFAALKNAREQGATLIAFLWPTYWWWDHYHDFMDHVQRAFPCIARSRNATVFRIPRNMD